MFCLFLVVRGSMVTMQAMFLPILFIVSLASGQSTVSTNTPNVCSNEYSALILSNLDTVISTLKSDKHNKEGLSVHSKLDTIIRLLENDGIDKGAVYVDCKHILDSGQSTGTGVYTIYNPVDPAGKKEVYCDMETDGGGWLVFQRRVSDAVSFDNVWAQYVTGFGDVTGNLWLGNEILHRITYYKNQELRVDLQNWDNVTVDAKYQEFRVDSETNKYKLSVSGYSGSAGDSLSYHDGGNFCTKDRDYDTKSDGNCASLLEGAWWFKACEHSSLNGPYYQTETIDPVHYHGVSWDTVGGNHASLKISEMKIRPK